MVSLTMSPRIRRTPFHDAVFASGVTDVSVYNKMIMPTSYGDLYAEYQRLIEGVAIWDVSVERQIQIAGPDADACAQYLTARDLSKMKVGQGKYVAMCDHAGRILNDPILMKLSGDRYWFSIADSDMLLWSRAIAGERGFDVDVTEPDVSPLALQGPLAEDLVAELFGDEIRQLKYFWFTETHLDDIPIVVCRSGWSKQGGFELFLQDASRGLELWEHIIAAGEKYGIGPGAPNHVERVESGLLSFGADNTPDSNPFEAGMGRFVTTECEADYVGKAALQKVAATGPERLLVGLNIDVSSDEPWPLQERAPVWLGDEQVGTVSAIVHSHRLGRTIGVAQVRADLIGSDQSVSLDSGPDRVNASIQELPFI